MKFTHFYRTVPRASMYKGPLTHNLLCSKFVELTLILYFSLVTYC